jgi:hypothetical protein
LDLFDGLQDLPLLVLTVNDLGRSHGKLKALPAQLFKQNAYVPTLWNIYKSPLPRT